MSGCLGRDCETEISSGGGGDDGGRGERALSYGRYGGFSRGLDSAVPGEACGFRGGKMTFNRPSSMCFGRCGGGVLDTAPNILALDLQAFSEGPGSLQDVIADRLGCQDSHSTSGMLLKS